MKFVFTGACPVCQGQITVDLHGQGKPGPKPVPGAKSSDQIKLEAEEFVLSAIKLGKHFNNDIAQWVAENDPEWRWKAKHSIVGFVLTKMVKEGKISKSPHLNLSGHYVTRFDLPKPQVRLTSTGSVSLIDQGKETPLGDLNVKERNRP